MMSKIDQQTSKQLVCIARQKEDVDFLIDNTGTWNFDGTGGIRSVTQVGNDVVVTTIPEPSTMALMGIAGFAAIAIRRTKI